MKYYPRGYKSLKSLRYKIQIERFLHMLQRLVYNVESDNSGNYLFSIGDSLLSELDLPVSIKDAISSFALSFSSNQTYFNRGSDSQVMFEYICSKIKTMFERHWDQKYGIPVVSFHQYPARHSETFRHDNLVVFFTKQNNEVEIETWQKALSSVSNITFVAELSEFGFSIITSDHKFVYSWLNQKKFMAKASKPVDRLTVENKLKIWFPKEKLRNALMTEAKNTIDSFVVEKSFNIFIPEYMFIESSHAKRFKISQEILTKKYDPEFIMTLPMIHEGKLYTVLFPVCGKFTKNNIRGF